MTEYERIAEKRGWSQQVQDEVKCDFLVTSKMRKVQLIGLDLLLEFDRVCREHQLKYFLIGGTLLGAIRHKGFIPWDDDIDVAMLRKDYEQFLEIAPHEFSEPYFLQTPDTDPGYYFSYTKVRNSNTSAISYPFRYENFNQGIAIDIFPLDNARLEDLEERYTKIDHLILENSANMRRSNPNPTEEDLRRMAKYPYRNPMEVWKEMDAEARRYEHEETEYVNIALCTIYVAPKLCYAKNLFDDVANACFEGYMLSVPSGYQEVLKQQYADYMVYPSVEQRGTWHSSVWIDPDVSYKSIQVNSL